jgi:hypothetical protein
MTRRDNWMRDIVDRLVASRDATVCLAEVDAKYDKLTTKRSALSRIKAAAIARNIRHDDYDAAMHAARASLRNDPAREATLVAFGACPLSRQLKIQHKIRMGQHDGLCDDRDVEVYRDMPLCPPWIAQLHLSPVETQAVIESGHGRLLELSTHVVHIEAMDDRIFEARRIIRDDAAPLDSLAVALAMCTGRRMVELLLTGSFSPDPYGGKYTVVFSGQAKAGARAITSMTTDTPLTYRIPVLASSTSIVRGVARLRLLAPATSPTMVNTRYCRPLNARAKAMVHPGIRFHDLRTVYALVTFEAFRPHHYGLNGWVAKVLGHSGLGMSVHYTRMQVSGIHRIRRHNTSDDDDGT